ncbi:hypothetical protein [Oryza sativa Japonica Group]|uniref:Uncharacterized protein n=1 Tax=Oryza sativa subsp. japonica TaxID=39947 RepID=Q5NBE9_ORYSJ|nr:hypothetical protein [Oryza sativa Japonica Group]
MKAERWPGGVPRARTGRRQPEGPGEDGGEVRRGREGSQRHESLVGGENGRRMLTGARGTVFRWDLGREKRRPRCFSALRSERRRQRDLGWLGAAPSGGWSRRLRWKEVVRVATVLRRRGGEMERTPGCGTTRRSRWWRSRGTTVVGAAVATGWRVVGERRREAPEPERSRIDTLPCVISVILPCAASS